MREGEEGGGTVGRWAHIDITDEKTVERKEKKRKKKHEKNNANYNNKQMAAPGSTLTFLHQVSSHPANTKVRFLGWYTPPPPPNLRVQNLTIHSVTSYDAPSATLTLSHPPSAQTVDVNVALLVTSLQFGALRDGEWVNVIGYTTDSSPVRVDAIMVWSAEGVALGTYERALQERLEGEASM